MARSSVTPDNLASRLLSFFVLFIALLAFSTVTVMIIKDASVSNALVYTLETMAFMFHDETGAAKVFEIFISIFGVFLVWWILWSIFDIIFEGNVAAIIHALQTKKRLENMRNHDIIAGGGRVGYEIAHLLLAEKRPHVIIEKDTAHVQRLRKEGMHALKGDVMDEKLLIIAGIKHAKRIFIASPQTEENLVITMLARELNPTIEIHARADKPEFVNMLKKAGAKAVVIPEVAAAQQLVGRLA